MITQTRRDEASVPTDTRQADGGIAAADGRAGDDAASSPDFRDPAAGWEDAALAKRLKMPLMKLCVLYLTGDPAATGVAVTEPMARFHLLNGASVDRIDWLANTSMRGMAESFALMVNDRYDLDRIGDNHRVVVQHGRVTTGTALFN